MLCRHHIGERDFLLYRRSALSCLFFSRVRGFFLGPDSRSPPSSSRSAPTPPERSPSSRIGSHRRTTSLLAMRAKCFLSLRPLTAGLPKDPAIRLMLSKHWVFSLLKGRFPIKPFPSPEGPPLFLLSGGAFLLIRSVGMIDSSATGIPTFSFPFPSTSGGEILEFLPYYCVASDYGGGEGPPPTVENWRGVFPFFLDLLLFWC